MIEPVERASPVDVTDIDGSENLEHEWGDRFRGWYLTKTPLKAETFPLGIDDLTYRFTVCDYNIRFIMPSKLEFIDGLITYTPAERLLGVFRFPRNQDGFFAAPVTLKQKEIGKLLEMTPEQIQELIGKREVLTFEAFRVPQFGFEFLSISEKDFIEIERLTGGNRYRVITGTTAKFSKEFRQHYETKLNAKFDEVKEKIKSTPNNLLILENTLNRNLAVQEISSMTSGIIHV